MIKLNLFFILISCSVILSQEKINISGFILNEEKEPMEGLIVHLEDLNINTLSNEKGFFKFNNITNNTHHFHIKSHNYKFICKKISVLKDTTIYIILNSKFNILGEMVLEDKTTHIKQRKSVNSISFISKESIKDFKYSSISDIVSELPGIRKMNTGISISKPVIRGMSGDRVSVYDTGIKQEDQQWGNDHGLQINKYDADKIQVERGSSTIMFSGANGGVINISPDIFFLDKKKIIEGSLSSNYRLNNNLFEISNQTKINLNDNNLLDIRLNYQRYSDYVVPENSFNYNNYIFPIEKGRLKNTSGEDKGFSFIYKSNQDFGFFMIKLSYLNQKNGLFSGAVGIPTISNTKQDGDYSNIDLPYQDNNHFKFIFFIKTSFLGNWLENSFGFQNNLREEYTIPANHGRKIKRTDNLGLKLKLTTFSNNLRYNIDYDNNNFYLGFYSQLQENSTDGFEFLIPNYNSFFTEVYSVYRYELEDKFAYEFGAKLGYDIISSKKFEVVYEFSNKNDYLLSVNPLNKNYLGYSFSGGFSYFPLEEFSYKFNTSLVYKFPIIPELASNGIHHGTFRHEKGEANLNLEQGITLENEFYYLGEFLALKITPFYSYYWNYIFLSPSLKFSPLPEGGQIYQYKQVPAYFFGIEFNTIINLYSDLLSLNIKGDYLYSINKDNLMSLPFTPPPYAKIVLEYKPYICDLILNFRLSQDFCYTQNRVAINEKQTNGYSTTDFSISTTIFNNFDISFDITNIFNVKYFAHLSRYRILDIPEQGRNVLFGLNYNF